MDSLLHTPKEFIRGSEIELIKISIIIWRTRLWYPWWLDFHRTHLLPPNISTIAIFG